MEAGRGALHWARQLLKLGHQVKLMPAAYVKAFNIRNKNDAADARRESNLAGSAATSNAVAVKSETQQAIMALHRMRAQLMKFRTMQTNCLRGLLAEYGEVTARGGASLDRAIPPNAGKSGRTTARVLDRHAARAVEWIEEAG
jgi:transposase